MFFKKMFDDKYREAIEERIYREGVELKDEGRFITGLYCSFSPKELIRAAGAVPVSLCAGSQQPVEAAEEHLPRNLCPLIKSSYGFALTDSCRYFHETDLIVADSTCDGKKKMFELLNRLRPVHLLKIPQTQDDDGLATYLTQLVRVKELLESKTGREVTEEALSEEIKTQNRLRKAILRVYRLNAGPIPLLFGRELDNIAFTDGFDVNLDARIAEMEAAADLAETRAADDEHLESAAGRPRLLLTGCPLVNRKLLDIIEARGGLVAAMENCGGWKPLPPLVNENMDPLRALAEKYLATPCPCLSPNKGRLDLIDDLVKTFHIQGIVDLTWESCQLFEVETFTIREHASLKLDLPYLNITTDFSSSDDEQIAVRVEAFLELLGA